MDYLVNSLNIKDIVLAGFGVICITAFLAVVRIMRQGRKNFTTRHSDMDNRIRETQQAIRERNNAMQSTEQLHIIAATIKDALEQKGHNAHEIVVEFDDRIELKLAQGLISVHYLRKTLALRSVRKTVHGQGLWEVRQGNMVQTFDGLIQLERYLRALLAGL